MKRCKLLKIILFWSKKFTHILNLTHKIISISSFLELITIEGNIQEISTPYKNTEKNTITPTQTTKFSLSQLFETTIKYSLSFIIQVS